MYTLRYPLSAQQHSYPESINPGEASSATTLSPLISKVHSPVLYSVLDPLSELSQELMTASTSTKRRRALGPRDVNIFIPHLAPLKLLETDGNLGTVRKDYGGLPSKRSVEDSEEEQRPKAARHFGVPDRRVGMGYWLEDGIVDGSPSCPPGDDTGVNGQLVSSLRSKQGWGFGVWVKLLTRDYRIYRQTCSYLAGPKCLY